MRWLYRSLLSLILVLPTPLLAQAVTRADLVGTWVRAQTSREGGKTTTWECLVTLNADSTWIRVTKVNGEVKPGGSVDLFGPAESGQWYVAGDSLWLGDPAVTDTVFGGGSEYIGGAVQPKWGVLKATLNGGKLFLLGYDSPRKSQLNCNEFYCFERKP